MVKFLTAPKKHNTENMRTNGIKEDAFHNRL